MGSEIDDLAAAEDLKARMSSAASSMQYAYIMRKARAGDAFPRSSCHGAGVGFSEQRTVSLDGTVATARKGLNESDKLKGDL